MRTPILVSIILIAFFGQNTFAQKKTPDLIFKANAGLLLGVNQFFLEKGLDNQRSIQLGLHTINTDQTEGFELTPELRKYKKGNGLSGSYTALFGQLKRENAVFYALGDDNIVHLYEEKREKVALGMLWGKQGTLFKTLTFDAYIGPKLFYQSGTQEQLDDPYSGEFALQNGFGLGLRAGISVGIPLSWKRH